MMPPSRKSERGAALIATVVISLLLLGVIIWYLSQANLTAKIQTFEHSTEYALLYAESGLQLAEQALQVPRVLASSGTLTGSLEMPHGRCAYTLVRSSPAAEEAGETNPFQAVLVEATATGYYYIDKGQATDPANGRTARVAVLRAKFHFGSVGLFLAATPGRLRIHQETTALFGPVYARDLIFVEHPDPLKPPGVIEAAFFGDSVKQGNGQLNLAPSFMVFNSTNGIEAIGSIPHFPALQGKIRAYYENLAASEKNRLEHDATLEGRIEPPANSPFPVYFCEQDLHLGNAAGFEAAGPMIIYVKGNLVIHNSIQGVGNSWAVFLVEKDIQLAPSIASQPMHLRGNFITNGALQWKGSEWDTQSFSLNLVGSLLAGRGFDPIIAGIPKKFIRWQVDDAVLPLPRFTQKLETRILVGKYRR